MKVVERCKCLRCGSVNPKTFEVYGDYDSPDEMRTEPTCVICTSAAYAALEARCRELEAALRSLVDGVEQSDAYYVKDELTAAHAILEPQTESGTPRGEAGDRAGPLVSPHSAKETTVNDCGLSDRERK